MRFSISMIIYGVLSLLIESKSIESQSLIISSMLTSNNTFSSGNTLVSGGEFQLNGTVGQPIIGIIESNSLMLQSGFFPACETISIIDIQPPLNVRVSDRPEDHGHYLNITWDLSLNDSILSNYYIYRSRCPELTTPISIDTFDTLESLMSAEETNTIHIGSVDAGINSYIDSCVPLNNVSYYYWVAAVSIMGSVSKFSPSGSLITSVETTEFPERFKLIGNFPNPFNPVTTIHFDLPEDCRVTIKIYSATGQHVETLINESVSAGNHKINWQPKGISTGIYLYVLEAGNKRFLDKMVLLK